MSKIREDVYITRNDIKLSIKDLSIKTTLNGIKLKDEPLLGIRIYQLNEGCNPPYEIIWHAPDMDVTCMVSLDTWDLENQFNDSYKLFMPGNQEYILRVDRLKLSDPYVELDFMVTNPPIRNSEKVLE